MDGREQYLSKPLPSSEESERVILGSILMDNATMQSAAESIEAEDFYSPLNRRVFAAMLTLYAAQKTIEPTMIGEELKKEGSLESIGGVTSIANLSFGLPFNSNITEHLEIVRQKSYLRQLVRTCNAITQNALSEETETASVFADAQGKINDLCLAAESGESDEHFVMLSKIIDSEVMPALQGLREGRSSKMLTGFAGIDSAIGGGIAPSDVLLVAADTGKGKSSFALQMAYNFAAQGIPSAFLAGEMTNKENVLRLVSQMSGITNLNWKTHISESEFDGAVEWAQHIKAAPIQFEHRISDMHTLASHLRAVVRRNKVKVLVIDYIQLFKMEKTDKRKRNERIAEASQEVKRLANELNIAIIEVAQFNREGAKSVQAGLHDLEGSGQLEKDASLIFILELSDGEFLDTKGRKYNEAKIRVVKGRNVGKGEVVGKFYGQSVQFDFA